MDNEKLDELGITYERRSLNNDDVIVINKKEYKIQAFIDMPEKDFQKIFDYVSELENGLLDKVLGNTAVEKDYEELTFIQEISSKFLIIRNLRFERELRNIGKDTAVEEKN